MLIAHSLTQPIGSLVREAPVLSAEDSLMRAAETLRDHAFSTLFVANGPEFVGLVTEKSLLEAQANGVDPFDRLDKAIVTEFPRLEATMSGAEAMRFFSEFGVQEALVVDASGRPHGLLAPSDLYPKTPFEPRPAMVGGMATPFGVYLTNGTLRAGAGDLALVATGAMLFLLFVASTQVSHGVENWAAHAWPKVSWLQAGLTNILPMALFLFGVRAIPLAGIHAAEHKVVHAIERGEPLEPQIVSRMSRVHPRCGTNLAAAATLFLGISGSKWIPYDDVRFLVAVLVTLFFWRPLGSLLQLYVTTRPPNAKQLDMGIRAGKELLAKFQKDRHSTSNPFMRIWASGMLHVMAGSTLAFFALDGISRIFNFDIIL